MQQLHAKIKPSSKYFFQNKWAEAEGPLPFPVTIDPEPAIPDYHVLGGPGGRYRLADVEVFIIKNGCELKIA